MEIDNKLLLENSKNISVLYVEDDTILRESTCKLLSNFFKDIDIAEDGEIGLRKYKAKLEEEQCSYDLIISDINMPNMNGIEMCESMKSFVPEQAIIFVTAFNETEYLSRAIEIGVQGFLSKPIEMKSLKITLYNVTQMIVERKLLQNYYEQIEDLNMVHIDQKDASSFQSVKDIYQELSSNKVLLSKSWTQTSEVKEKLLRYGIEPEFFRVEYGIQVIEYILDIVSGKEELGNSPIFFMVLELFKSNTISLNDIFIIYVSLKNTLISYIFEHYSFNQNIYDEISNITDKNLEELISSYVQMQYTDKSSSFDEEIKEENQTQNSETVNYIEYVLEHDVYELQDLEEDIDTLAIAVTENTHKTREDFDTLGVKIKRYGRILNNYTLFIELGKYVIKLGENFSDKAQVLYDDPEKMHNIASLIEGFVNDLIMWRKEIFENNIEDPHFLDQSFASNVETIIMMIEYDESNVVESEDTFDDMFF